MSTDLFRKLPRSSVFILLTSCGLLVDDLKSDEPATSPPASMPGKEAGQVRNDNRLEMELVWCPPGKFKMGSPDSELKRAMNEGPQVEVNLTKGFWLGKCEVTQGQWESLMETTPWDGQAGVQEGDHNPATFVNWEDATEFCNQLTSRERNAGRLPKEWVYTLPTEAQWEYACRAGTTTPFFFGDDVWELGNYAWFGKFYEEDGKQTVASDLYAHEVALKKPNPWGLHDVHGNVWEWCQDWYGPTIDGGTDPVGPVKGSERVVRGGGFFEPSWASRSARRGGSMVTKRKNGRVNYVGFRVACSPTQTK